MRGAIGIGRAGVGAGLLPGGRRRLRGGLGVVMIGWRMRRAKLSPIVGDGAIFPAAVHRVLPLSRLGRLS